MAGLLMLILGIVLSFAGPNSGAFSTFSTFEVATMAVVDLHFGLPIHVLPQFLLARFQEFAPAPSVFGILYVIPPLVLYTTGKAVANMSEDREDPVDGILNGIPIVFGYLPMMIVVVLLMPGGGGGPNSPDIATALLMSGIVYPLVFGVLGGIVDAHYPADSRRVGVGYGAAMVLVMTLLLLLSTFVIVSVPAGIDIPFGDRLFLSVFLLGAVQTLEGVGNTGVGVPLILAALTAFGIGYLRTWRTGEDLSLLHGFTRPLTAAWTYLVLVGAFVTIIPIVADSYASSELNLGNLVSAPASGLVTASLSDVSGFINLVVLGTVIFPIVLGGLGGLTAAYVQMRQAMQAAQPAAQPGAPGGGHPAGGQAAGGQGGRGQPPAGQQAGGRPPAGQQAGGQPPAGQGAGGQPPAGQEASGQPPAGRQAGGQPPAGGEPTGGGEPHADSDERDAGPLDEGAAGSAGPIADEPAPGEDPARDEPGGRGDEPGRSDEPAGRADEPAGTGPERDEESRVDNSMDWGDEETIIEDSDDEDNEDDERI